MKVTSQFRIDSLIKAALLGLLFYALYQNSWVYLAKEWSNEDFNYCYLIPVIVLYLIWEKRQELRTTPSRPTWAGFILVGIGLGLFWLGELGGEYTALFLSFWAVLVGIVWACFGFKKTRVIWFPLVFILAAFTPPDFIYFGLTLQLKLISSQLGVAMLQAYGMSAYREGNVIDLGFTQLQVVDACSGLRYLFPLLIMALLLAYFFRLRLWKCFILVLSAIPLTIFTNSVRIAMTGVLYEIWGPAVAEDFFHGFSGWFIFMFGFAGLLVVMWVLQKIFPEKKLSAGQESSRGAPCKSEAGDPMTEASGGGPHEPCLSQDRSNPDGKA